MPTEIFNQAEIKIIILGLQTTLEDLEEASKNQNFNFTPDARKDMREMITAGYSAKKKLEEVVHKGIAFKLDKYQEGDEKDFITKQS